MLERIKELLLKAKMVDTKHEQKKSMSKTNNNL